MSGIPFENTRRGAEYYDHHIPKIAKSLERIANALEKVKQVDQVRSMTDEFIDREMRDLMRRTIRCEESTQTGWISVEDKLPEEDVRVIVYSSIKTIGIAYQINNLWFTRDLLMSSPCDKITHWMPLPEPPEPRKEVKDNE